MAVFFLFIFIINSLVSIATLSNILNLATYYGGTKNLKYIRSC
jgi:hypothetical protein